MRKAMTQSSIGMHSKARVVLSMIGPHDSQSKGKVVLTKPKAVREQKESLQIHKMLQRRDPASVSMGQQLSSSKGVFIYRGIVNVVISIHRVSLPA